MKLMNVCVVTGTRAEFGIWRPILQAIQRSRMLHLHLVVTGMHLQKEFGATEKQIAEEGFKAAARVPMYRGSECAANSLARGIKNLAAAYQEIMPDLVMVLGDRLEMLAAASAALTERIPIAHLHGGETAPGIWDEQIRHAITKMAQLHFCATETARRRIVRMGENPACVHCVGAPALDLIQEFWTLVGPTSQKMRHYRRQGKRGHAALLVLHPSGETDEEEYAKARAVLTVIKNMNLELQVIGPNNDPGHAGILQAYKAAGVVVNMSVSQQDFWRLAVYSSVLVGNSSAGIIEAASLALPVVNVGNRQAGRERNANVIDVDWDRRSLDAGLRKAVDDTSFFRQVARRKNLYGDGNAAPRIVAVLEKIARGDGLSLAKRFVD